MRHIAAEVPLTVRLIVGPTGVGKSAAASDVARRTGAPVVVADRIQCFTDLATTSARAGADEPDVTRAWLGDRTVADGDYPAPEAAAALVRAVRRVARPGRPVVVEGGSISLLAYLVDHHLPVLPWRFTVTSLTRPAPSRYLAALTARAHAMLRPEPPLAGLLDELAALWRVPGHRWFAASVNGFEAALEWCAKYGLDPTEPTLVGLPPRLVDELALLIAERHAEHGADQERAFAALFAPAARAGVRLGDAA
ncbi:isopentenyl transferase family protein [Streptomyces hainanensis]|uniref:isopentenyl transferase family protein n=1 Tax=Streptomyces hainanensis TaxID=402648 RepID=UPI001FB5F6A9|nr:isopentenyl transferase family protein [Streptomyces hainanensis]